MPIARLATVNSCPVYPDPTGKPGSGTFHKEAGRVPSCCVTFPGQM